MEPSESTNHDPAGRSKVAASYDRRTRPGGHAIKFIIFGLLPTIRVYGKEPDIAHLGEVVNKRVQFPGTNGEFLER